MSIHLLNKHFLNKVLKQPLYNLKLCSIFQKMHILRDTKFHKTILDSFGFPKVLHIYGFILG